MTGHLVVYATIARVHSREVHWSTITSLSELEDPSHAAAIGALPDAILHKTGLLTAEERALMQTHSERGAEVLARYKDFTRGAAIVRHHHEAWDGSGYPHGLKGVEIPFGARVLAVADSFDAMTTDRPYRRGMSVAKAVGILRQGRGQQWDPQVVDAFLRSLVVQGKRAPSPLLQVLPSALEMNTPTVGA